MNKKKFVSLFMAMVMSFSIFAQAALPVMAADEPVTETENVLMTEEVTEENSGTVAEGITWALENGVLTITGTGEIPDFNFIEETDDDLVITDAPWIDHNASITSVVIGEGITRVGNYAFAGYPNITSLSLPEGLLSVGHDSFMLYNGTELNLPSTLKEIEEYGFRYCNNLETLHIPASVSYIRQGAFGNCPSLSMISVAEGSTTYQVINGMLYDSLGQTLCLFPCNLTKEVVVPEGTMQIDEYAFWGAWQVTSLELPSTLETIDHYAFWNMSGLTSVVIPEGVTYLGEGVFRGCDGLKEITIPVSLTTIYPYTFKNCTSLETVRYNGTAEQWAAMTVIADGNDYFTGATVTFGGSGEGGDSGETDEPATEGITWSYDGETGTLTFSGTGEIEDQIQYEQPWFEEYKYNCTNIVVEEGITSIGDYAFYNMMANTITLPEGLTRIGQYAFTAGSGVNGGINIPSTLKTIGQGAFCDVTGPITIAEGSEFTLVDGVLYRYGKYILAQPTGLVPEKLTIPSGTVQISDSSFMQNTIVKSVVMSDTVEGIYGMAFAYAGRLEEVISLDGLTYIGSAAFFGCTNLKKVVLPTTLTTIANMAFYDTHEDLVICYMGSEDQWNNIAIGDAIPDTAEIVFNYEYIPPAEGSLSSSIEWALVDGVLTISGTGAMPDYDDRAEAPWYSFKDSIRSVVIGEGITHVGKRAFFGYKTTSLSLPEGLESIGKDAFASYAGTELVLPSTLTTIGTDAFATANEITTLHIHANLTSDVGDAFGSCASITEFTVDENHTLYSVKDGVLYSKDGKTLELYPIGKDNEFTVPEGVTTIGNKAFWGAHVYSISLPSTLTTLEKQAFYVCQSLESIIIPEGVTVIPEMCFAYNNVMEEITLPSTLTTVEWRAFDGCSALAYVNFGGTKAEWTAITSTMGTGNDVLLDVTVNTAIGDNVTDTISWSLVGNTLTLTGTGTMPDYAPYADTPVPAPWNAYKDSIKNVVIGAGILNVGAFAFDGCTVEKVSLPEGLTSIGEAAFNGYAGTQLVLPSTVQTLGDYAFGGAKNITTVEIPAAMTGFNALAFNSCTSLAAYTVADGNEKYAAEDGVLFETYTDSWGDVYNRTLVRYPAAGPATYTIPYQVTTIAPYAFEGALVKEVFMEDSVETIEMFAFANCVNLETIQIKYNVETIDDFAFAGSTALKRVLYAGDEEEWNNIAIGTGNNALTDAERIYDAYSIYTLTIVPSENGKVETNLEGNWYVDNQPVELTAVPEEGYRLVEFAYILDRYGEEEYHAIDGYQTTVSTWYDMKVVAVFEPIILGEGQLTETISWAVENRVLNIMGSGKMPQFSSAQQQPWYSLADKIEAIIVEDGIIQIGSHAFEGLANAQWMDLPSTCTWAGEYAFAGMTSITDWMCIPDTMTFFGRNAFSGNYAEIFRMPMEMRFTSAGSFNGFEVDVLNIHSMIFGIEDGTFESADLDYVVYDGLEEEWNNISIGANNDPLLNATISFESNVEISGTLTTGHSWNIDIGNGELMVEGNGAMPDFEQGSAPWESVKKLIRRVAVGSGVTYIGQYAFADLPNLERVRIFDDAETIGAYAFANSPVDYLTFASSVKTIGEYAFSGVDRIDYHHFYYGGMREDYNAVEIAEGNDSLSWPNHINVPVNVDWVDVNFETGVEGIYVDPIALPRGFNINTNYHQAAREGYVLSYWWNNAKFEGRPYEWQTDKIWEDTTFYAQWTCLKTTGDDLPEDSKVTKVAIMDENGKAVTSAKVSYFGEGFYYYMNPVVTGSGSYSDQLTVTVSNGDVAYYDPYEGGYAYAFYIKSAGTTKITFASKQNPAIKTTFTLNVVAKATEAELVISKNETTFGAQILTLGQTVTPSVNWIGGEAWAKDSYEIFIGNDTLEMTADGKIKAAKAGDTFVWLHGFDEENGRDIYAEAHVFVYEEKVSSIELSTEKLVLDNNAQRATFSADSSQMKWIEAWPANEGAYNEFDITWTASSNIVVCDWEGNPVTSATGRAVCFYALNSDKGSITVTFKAKDGSGKTAKATVQTGVAVQYIQLTLPAATYGDFGPEVSVAVGKSVKATTAVTPADATIKTLKWSAWTDETMQEATDVVSVSGGTVKGLKPGRAFVHAMTTDGTGRGTGFFVNVVNPAAKVVINDGEKTAVITRHHDGYVDFTPTFTVLGADSTTDGVSQDVKITVAGTNGKYVESSQDEYGQWHFSVNRAGKYTVKATTTDGTNKSATITVDVQQHVFDFAANPPKNTQTYVDENGDTVWVVKAGTTVTPQVVYNYGDKLLAPVSAAKKYTITATDFAPADTAVAQESCLTFNTARTNVKAVQPGLYTLEIKAVEIENCENPSTPTYVKLKVIPKNSVEFVNVWLKMNGTYIDSMYAGTAPQGVTVTLTPYLGDVKATNIITEWGELVSAEGNTGTATFASGKLNLKNAQPGDVYTVPYKLI